MERIWGPVNGFYFAAYAAPVAEGDGFCSYAKVCWSQPEDYWDADCAFKIFGGEHHRSLEAAMEAVAREARNEISYLPRQARSLALQHRRTYRPRARPLLTAFFGHRWA